MKHFYFIFESLSSITIYSEELLGFPEHVFDNNAEDRKIYVLDDKVDYYRTGWSQYADDIWSLTPSNTTAIEKTYDASCTTCNDTWHTLSGMKLNAAPTRKGIYIHNGRKEAIR